MISKVWEENEYSPRAARRARNFFQVWSHISPSFQLPSQTAHGLQKRLGASIRSQESSPSLGRTWSPHYKASLVPPSFVLYFLEVLVQKGTHGLGITHHQDLASPPVVEVFFCQSQVDIRQLHLERGIEPFSTFKCRGITGYDVHSTSFILWVLPLAVYLCHTFRGGGISPDPHVLVDVQRVQLHILLDGLFHGIQLILHIPVPAEGNISCTQML